MVLTALLLPSWCADEIAAWVVESVNTRLRRQPTYRGSIPTLSVLTITVGTGVGWPGWGVENGHRSGCDGGAPAALTRNRSGLAT